MLHFISLRCLSQVSKNTFTSYFNKFWWRHDLNWMYYCQGFKAYCIVKDQTSSKFCAILQWATISCMHGVYSSRSRYIWQKQFSQTVWYAPVKQVYRNWHSCSSKMWKMITGFSPPAKNMILGNILDLFILLQALSLAQAMELSSIPSDSNNNLDIVGQFEFILVFSINLIQL